MTATARPDVKERQMPEQAAKIAPYGSFDDLFCPAKTAEVEINGKRFCFKELNQGEVENVSFATLIEETDDQGKATRRSDFHGNMARWVAHAMVKPDGSPMFANPMVDYLQVNKLPRDVVRTLFEVVDKLNALSPEAKGDMGKGSGGTAGSGS